MDGRANKSLAHRKKISKTMKGREFTKEHKANLAKSSFWKGRPRKKSFKLLSQ